MAEETTSTNTSTGTSTSTSTSPTTVQTAVQPKAPTQQELMNRQVVNLKDLLAGTATTAQQAMEGLGNNNVQSYACTVEDLYPEGTRGHDDMTARQIVYVRASSPSGAEAQMKNDFPMFKKFTATLAE